MYQIYGMKCNDLKRPQGIADKAPVFSWRLASKRQGCAQRLYRILVLDEDGKCVWDSGECLSRRTFGVSYAGEPLKSSCAYRWQVKSVDNQCREAVSEWETFTTGILEPQQWNAFWIEADYKRKPENDCKESWKLFAGLLASCEHPEEFLNPPVYMKREFEIKKEVKKAYLYATARGIYALDMDGNGFGELLAPGFTKYADYVELQQYDVTDLLYTGSHRLGVILADGWYTGKIGLMGVGEQFGTKNAFAMQMELYYADGTRETVISDQSFWWTTGAYEYADLFVGERYNGTLPEWERDDWRQVVLLDDDFHSLKGRESEPVREIRVIGNLKKMITPKGELVFDAGENIAGYVSVCMKGKKGQHVTFRHSEVLDQDGNFLMNILGQNKNQTDVYIFGEDGTVTYQPRFTFHGFRYVKVDGIETSAIQEISVHVIATDLERTGTFCCSDELINRLQENIFRSQQGNMISIPTDCPQRERAGWTGDMQIYAPTACYNMDVKSFLRKWLANMRLEQRSDGQIPNTIPHLDSDKYISNSSSEHICSSGWGDACVIVPYVLYHKYGDPAVLQENFEMMERWLRYVEKQASTTFPKPLEEYPAHARERQKYLWNTEFHFGDWLFPSMAQKGYHSPTEASDATGCYVATCMYAYSAKLMEEICLILGKRKQAQTYGALNRNIREAFAEEYVDERGHLPLELQGLYVLALQMGMIPPEKRTAAVEALKALIHENGDCLDTGFLSVPFLLDVLYEHGNERLAYTLLFQTKAPSWLYQVKNGATTIWEAWRAIEEDGTRTNVSYNHFAFGCVGDFIYRRILGIQPLAPGYGEVCICPGINCGLTQAQGTLETVRGRIEVFWKKEKERCLVDVMLPPNVTGRLVVGAEEIPLESGTYSHIFA